MGWSRLTPVSSGDILRISKVQQMYDNMQNIQEPALVASINSEGSALNHFNSAVITSTSYVSVDGAFNISFIPSGRRVMVLLPLVLTLSSVTANAAVGELALLVNGVIDTGSIVRIYSPANAAGVSFSSLLSYTHIINGLASVPHGFALRARIASGTSASMSVYWQPKHQMVVKDY